jgi:hypothetical protein
MSKPTHKHTPTPSDLQIALSDLYSDTTYGAVPFVEQSDALETYRAFDDGGLAEAPLALAAYVDHQQHASF